MFRLDNLLERWATIYAPMRHNPSAAAKPEDRAFFRIDRLELENAFTRTFNLLKRPALCACVNFEAQLDEHKPRLALYHYQLYICQKQQGDANYMQDDDGAADTKCDLNQMTLDLLAFLFTLQDAIDGHSFKPDVPQSVRDLFASLTDEDRRGIKGLRMDDTEWWSVPRFKNGWWIMGIELYGLDSRQLCIVPSRYVDTVPLPSSLADAIEGTADPHRVAPRRGRKP